ncbi:tyrosine-type recombinase/integrase [Brevundimonas sp. Root1279]|uniref:tyrosine-type recombinase/integrase n=1 Tax=Brevundimonas sp. Root1279 TaxID=1736443 RepID=UPI0006FD2B33|nr:site-specific integrase [Brevundimonas sp. Root1279]KQW80778.1 integrase [Brevundimonas sp. Root1279]
MPRPLHKLSPRAVLTSSEPGRYGDGGGLYLVVSPSGSRKWVFRFRWKKRLSDMGLGSASVVTLARARERAAAARLQLSEGINPLEEKRAKRSIPLFGVFADELVISVKDQWKNEKHAAQVQSTLVRYAAKIRSMPLDQIETAHVLQALRPIWTTKAETAGRVQSRIQWVLDAAKAQGYRTGENPARWKGHLDQLLPKRSQRTKKHHAALPFAEVPAFVQDLRGKEATAALALEFIILTATRSGEVRGATWSEVDFEAAVWTIPASRMKAGKEHRVPLTPAMVALLESLLPLTGDLPTNFIFPGPKGPTVGLSDAAFSALLRRMGRDGAVTAHGFRSSFRDWCGETTNYPRDLAELALAHAVGDMTERAYRRGDALAKRRVMMREWSIFCIPGSDSLDDDAIVTSVEDEPEAQAAA